MAKATLKAIPLLSEFIPKEWNDISELSFCELQEHIVHFCNKASIEAEKDNRAKAAFYLMAAERYFTQSKLRLVIEI